MTILKSALRSRKAELSGWLLWSSLFLPAANAFASPLSDLSSPSQEVRDKAAEIVRREYAPPSRHNWEWILQSVKSGDTKRNFFKLLHRYNRNLKLEIASVVRQLGCYGL